MDTGKLDFDAYQQEALKTARYKEGEKGQGSGAAGLAGETSELLELFLDSQIAFLKAARLSVLAGKTVDYLKKVVFHSHPLDKEKVKKELGDVLWYCALVAESCGLSLNDVAQANVTKLRARYTEGFTIAESLSRKPTDT